MEFFHFFTFLFHSVGAASEGSSGWIPSVIGAGLGTYGHMFTSAVHSQVQQNQQQDQSTGNKSLEDRANSLP